MATDQTTGSTAGGPPAAQRPPTAAERRANEHAGTTDTEVLARDIAQTREELSVTIDAIVDRVSPKKVVERSKQQAREGVQEATETVKVHATTAAGIVKEKALVASEAVKEKVAELKDKASGTSDASDVRSPLTPATSVRFDSATPVAEGPPASAGGSPLPASTVSLDAGTLPPPEPATGADLPSHRPVGTTTTSPASVPPVYAGAGAAALLAAVLLLLRRRSNRRRTRVRRRR